MSHIVLGFSHHRRKLISVLVRWFTHGNYSHVMLLEPNGRRYVEASGSASPSGVRIHDLEDFLASRPEWEFRTIEHPNPMAVWRIACSQEGKKYDWAYFLGWLFLHNWQSEQRWVCNELITWACSVAGHPLFTKDAEPDWLTPQHLFLISKPLE